MSEQRGPNIGKEQSMELGAFSISLAVKDLAASKAFYEKLGFTEFGGDASENWLILRNGPHVIGLFDSGIGGVAVLNRGYSAEDQEWREAVGKAYFVEDENTGYLKVSFFGPFYGSYVVFELDKDAYQYAFVAGYNKSYLWLLSRTPDPGEAVVERFLSRSRKLGFDTDKLIFVDHTIRSGTGR